MGEAVTPAWLRPTRRAIDWTPLTLITAALLVTAAILGSRGLEVPDVISHLAVAGLAAAAVLGLGDNTRPLLDALPTRAIARLGHRALLLTGATVLAAGVLVTTERLLDLSPTTEPGRAAALLALAALGTAVYAATHRMIDHAHEVSAAAILLLVAGSSLTTKVIPDTIRLAWLRDPWPVVSIAMVVILASTTRRSA